MATPLEKYLYHLIREKDGISIADYMQTCLTHACYGYYMRGNPLGAQGDFITSPEISQMFGELIGVWFQDLWQQMKQPFPPYLIELGPGRGTMMQDLLRAFPSVFKIHMVEISPAFQFEQRQKLQGHRVQWHTTIDDALKACAQGPIFVVANEFFDALPIHQFQKTSQSWQERIVTLDSTINQLCFRLRENETLNCSAFPLGVENDIIETSPLSMEIIQKISQAICRQGGAALIIDYGYRHRPLVSTLQAVRQHLYHDILKDPGLADLTAYVDFSALIREATRTGAKVMGPAFQGAFLTELGIEIRAKMLQRHLSAQQNTTVESALHRLIDPINMGTLFKVFAIMAPAMPEPCGFSTSGLAACSPLTNLKT